ncbi:MAG: hypothetical protein NT045_09775, partial [Candidatus Aureabacteria bacterium]|nr:hypothetical protein [Candidatus Auribacterota bacterium]
MFVVLIILAIIEAAGITYFYARYYSQYLTSVSLQDKLESTSATVKSQASELTQRADLIARMQQERDRLAGEKRTLEENLTVQINSLTEITRRLTASDEALKNAKDDAVRQQQIAAYLRVRYKESRELEQQMRTRIEELTAKESELDDQLSLADDTAVAPAAGIPLKETLVSDTAAANEITGQVLIANAKYNF